MNIYLRINLVYGQIHWFLDYEPEARYDSDIIYRITDKKVEEMGTDSWVKVEYE